MLVEQRLDVSQQLLHQPDQGHRDLGVDVLARDMRLRRSVVRAGSIAALVATVASCAAETRQPTSSSGHRQPGGALVPNGPDPAAGTPYKTASQASAAAGGFYVPDCPGHGTYYLE